MLGSDGLFDLQRVVDPVDMYASMLIYKLQNLQSEGVCKCAHNLTRKVKFLMIERNFSPVHKCSVVFLKMNALVVTNMH